MVLTEMNAMKNPYYIFFCSVVCVVLLVFTVLNISSVELGNKIQHLKASLIGSLEDVSVISSAVLTSPKNNLRRLGAEHNPKRGAFHQKMFAGNNTERHRRSWQVLETVDGLKNEEVAVLVTSTNNFEGAFLRERYHHLKITQPH